MTPLAWVGIAAAVVLALVAIGVGIVMLLGGDEPAQQPTTPAVPTQPERTVETPPAVEDDKPAEVAAAPAPGARSIDVQAAGVDLSWVELPPGTAYDAFEWVTDDSGAITVQVPTRWADQDLRLNRVSDVDVPSIWAAPDLGTFIDDLAGPGTVVELLSGAAATGSVESVLQRMVDAADDELSCSRAETYPYDDGWYVGSSYLSSGCGTADLALLQIVAAEGAGRMLTVEVMMATTADIEAAVQVINTFQAVTVERPAPAPAPAPAAPAPAPAPAAPAAPVTVYDLSPGLYCRDLSAAGFSYTEAVIYWELEGYPSRMDADNNGIPCETVYPASEIENYWGFTPGPAPAPAPAPDESAAVLEFAEQNMYTCGYSPTLDSWVEGPFADGGYTVSMNVDVGWDIVFAQFEVFPYSWQIYGFDAVADDLLACNY